ncbi:MAG TPA: ferrochelatase [Actinomycetales bacterium]|nr:ferrochelatase [Actinomycetales bacterium]
MTATPLMPYDALVLLSFGGPEGPDDVMPFLQNVTAGRGIPPERLEEVGEHYHLFGGRSPINGQNRALLDALRAELSTRGADVPVYWGNRNWEPYLVDALRQAHDDGARRVLVLTTSAYSSYSGCRQYREDVAAALLELAASGRALSADKVRHYFNHPGFVTANVDAVIEALGRLGASSAGARLVFVTHAIPTSMAETAGPDGGAYVAQHLDVAATVSAEVARRTGVHRAHDLVFCSRSGPPSRPWTGPDVGDHLEGLARDGQVAAVGVPIGFVSDHMEVVYDLDIEAAAAASAAGLAWSRAATAGTHAAFVAGLADLVVERAAAVRGEAVTRVAAGGLDPSHDVCPVGCCPNPRGDRPAACGADWQDPAVAG